MTSINACLYVSDLGWIDFLQQFQDHVCLTTESKLWVVLTLHSFDRKAKMKQHFITFMQWIFNQDHTGLAQLLGEGEECCFLPTFIVHHPHKQGQNWVVFHSNPKHLGVPLSDVLLTKPKFNKGLLGALVHFLCKQVPSDIKQMFQITGTSSDSSRTMTLWIRLSNTGCGSVSSTLRKYWNSKRKKKKKKRENTL